MCSKLFILYSIFCNIITFTEAFCISSSSSSPSCCSSFDQQRKEVNTRQTTKLFSLHDDSNEEATMLSQSPSSSSVQSRRNLFKVIGTGIVSSYIATEGVKTANALDMDAFMNKELNDDKNKLEVSDDIKTCKYAAPGKEKGDACVRAGMSTAGKNGGVDAYGNIDRGDFVRCKTSYPMIDGKYVKTVTCE